MKRSHNFCIVHTCNMHDRNLESGLWYSFHRFRSSFFSFLFFSRTHTRRRHCMHDMYPVFRHLSFAPSCISCKSVDALNFIFRCFLTEINEEDYLVCLSDPSGMIGWLIKAEMVGLHLRSCHSTGSHGCSGEGTGLIQADRRQDLDYDLT